MANQAAWVTEPKARALRVDSAANPKTELEEVVIKNAAISVIQKIVRGPPPLSEPC